MKFAIGADHRGFAAKATITQFLRHNGHDVQDFGAYSEESCDYPTVAVPTAQSVASGETDHGVLICGSGMGICIPANKVRGIRATAVYDAHMAEMARRHNNSNILCLSADMSSEAEMLTMLETWLRTEFEGGRHQRRLDQISDMETTSRDAEPASANDA